MDRTRCSPECVGSQPLGSENHISTCPQFGGNLLPFMPRNRAADETMVVRGADGRPAAVPDEVISEHERDWRAYKMHRAGKDWEEIARKELYESAAAAAASVKRYLDGGRAIMQEMTRAEIVADHVSRLQWMRSKLEAGIEAGKPASIMAGLAIEDRWVKAFGIDQQDEEGGAGANTVVVPSEEYLEYLRHASNGTPEASAG